MLNYDGARRVPSVCALRQSCRTSPESSRAALSGNVSYAYWMLENSDGEPGKCFSRGVAVVGQNFRREVGSKAPPYSHFLSNKTTKLWATGMRADASLGDVSVTTIVEHYARSDVA